MINLFFFIYDYSGTKTYANELLFFLAKQKNIEVYKVYMGSTAHNEYTVLREDGICTIHIPELKNIGNVSYKFTLRCLDVLDPLLLDKKHIIFHLNNPVQLDIGLKARIRYKAKIIYTLHCLPEYFSSFAKEINTIQEWPVFEDAFDKKLKSNVDRIICVTLFAYNIQKDYYRIPEHKLSLIYNGYSLIKKEKNRLLALSKEHLKASLGFSPKSQIILFVGRLMPGKGVEKLIMAFNRISAVNPITKLILVGNGEYDPYLKLSQKNIGRIIFTGKLTYDKVLAFYRIADMGVIPSGFEQCSYVALEMMKHGLPIIATDVSGLSELFEHKSNALLTNTNKRTDALGGVEADEDSLVKNITLLLKDKVLAKDIGENARLCWKKKYTAQHMGQATLGLYGKLLD